jgi:hypothetical protein
MKNHQMCIGEHERKYLAKSFHQDVSKISKNNAAVESRLQTPKFENYAK